MDSLYKFLIIYKVLYTWCLRYSIWSAWHLDIRIAIYKINGIIHQILNLILFYLQN